LFRNKLEKTEQRIMKSTAYEVNKQSFYKYLLQI